MYSFIFNFIHIFDKIMREREKTQYLILHFNVQREKKIKNGFASFPGFLTSRQTEASHVASHVSS